MGDLHKVVDGHAQYWGLRSHTCGRALRRASVCLLGYLLRLEPPVPVAGAEGPAGCLLGCAGAATLGDALGARLAATCRHGSHVS